MGKTVSMSVGRVAVLHDIRHSISENVDPTLTYRNEILVDKLADFKYDIEAYTNAKYQPFIDEYNQKQSRDDRKKNKPYTELLAEENGKLLQKAQENKRKGIKIAVRKPTKIMHEYVLQVGDRESDGVSNPHTDLKKHKEYAREVVEQIKQQYAHVDVVLAVLHADEPNGTPHLHLLVQFDGENYKQGLSHQISMSRALELDGFARSNNRGDYAINRWVDDIKNTIMTDKLKSIFHEDREIVGEHRKHEDVRIFRQKAREEEKALQEQREELDSYNKSQWQLLNDAHAELVTYRDKLVEQTNSLDADKNMLTTEQAEFEAYKEAQLQILHDKETSLLQYEQLGINYLSRAKQIYNNLSSEAEFQESKAKLYRQSIQRIDNVQVQLNESLLPTMPSREKQRTISL